jgi:hypothetical protein
MIMTLGQNRLLDIIRRTGYLTTIHAYRLLDKPAPTGQSASSDYPARVLKQLQHMQKIRLNANGAACLPHLADMPVDYDMLSTIDVMLDLSGNDPIAVSSKKPPFKLCFLSQRGDRLGSYGVVIAQPGDERRVCCSLGGCVSDIFDSRTVVFVLRNPRQRDMFKTPLPHYFAVFDAGKYRYFRGTQQYS